MGVEAKKPGARDVINDAEPCVAALYRAVRDHHNLVIERIRRMPHEHELYREARRHLGSSTDPASRNPEGLPSWELGA